MSDVTVRDHGSICTFEPLSAAAQAWIEEHLPADRMYFGRSVAIEPRCLADIVEGARNDGLEVYIC